MASQKLQVGRALAVIPSDVTDVPFPAIAQSGVTTAAVANKLVCATGLFETNDVKVGFIVWNTTAGTSANVIAVDSETQIELDADIFGAGDAFTIYQGPDNNGCVLYIGNAGNLEVTTVGGDRVVFTNLIAGQFVPVQILKVWDNLTTATNILALW